MTVYVLCGFDTTIDQDLERIYTLRDLGYNPYVMIYDKHKLTSKDDLRHMQRWVNSRIAFAAVKNLRTISHKTERSRDSGQSKAYAVSFEK